MGTNQANPAGGGKGKADMAGPESKSLAYLDTCIVSGIAKQDLPPTEHRALDALLRISKAGRVDVVTSEVTKKEIGAIPAPARDPHDMVYWLLRDVPTVQTIQVGSLRGMVGSRGGVLVGRRKYWEDRTYTELKGLLPDESDAEHVFQAVSAGATHFVTTDERTILRHAAELARWIAAMLPSQLVARLEGSGS